MKTTRILLGALMIVLAAASASGEKTVQYFALFMQGAKSGHVIIMRDAARDKVTTTVDVLMVIRRGEIPLTVRQTETSIETADGKPLGFRAGKDMGILTTSIRGTVSDGKVVVDGADGVKQTLDWPAGALLAEGVRLLTKGKGLKEGTTYSFQQFSPEYLRAVKVSVTVGPVKQVDLLGRVAQLTEMKTKTSAPSGTIESVRYVDDNGEDQKIIQQALGIKIVYVACDKAFALSENSAVDVFKKLLIASPGPLKGLAKVKAVTYDLTPAAGKKLSVPTTDNQSVRPGAKGAVVVTVRPVAAPAGAKFPYKGADKTALAALKSTRCLQCTDPKIVALARAAVGDTKDAAEAARRIEKFVRKHVKEKNLSVGYASASEVAVSGEGDCTEHAVLLAAMCRSIGIPAQVVTGIAYVDTFAGRKGVFGPHAWARALIGGKWIGLDAALSGYDAGHIALAAGDGDPTEFFGLVNTLGYFTIAKVRVEK